jgi:hypothetical protein
MIDLEAVLQAIRDFVTKLWATIEIEEQRRRLQGCPGQLSAPRANANVQWCIPCRRYPIP